MEEPINQSGKLAAFSSESYHKGQLSGQEQIKLIPEKSCG
jgi:hypothetical protein